MSVNVADLTMLERQVLFREHKKLQLLYTDLVHYRFVTNPHSYYTYQYKNIKPFGGFNIPVENILTIQDLNLFLNRLDDESCYIITIKYLNSLIPLESENSAIFLFGTLNHSLICLNSDKYVLLHDIN